MDNYEKTLSLRKKYESSPSTLKIIIQKEDKKNLISPKEFDQASQNQKSFKFNHFNIKIKDFSTLMLTTKNLTDARKLKILNE